MATTKIRKSSYSEQIIFYEKLLDKLDNKIKDIYVSKKIFNKRLKKVKNYLLNTETYYQKII